mmetsp:Transcript_12020/g.26016  ORF Transcript_12020/g.26016 Transcript_12020/m.26016 type:complete len:410 (+) Transcript_12020:73-1302(+)
MEKPQPSEEPALSSKAAKAAVESDWLINLEVSLIRDDEPNDEEGTQGTRSTSQNARKIIRVLQPPDVQVAAVRKIIMDATKIPEKEQRLWLASTGEPVLHGAVSPPNAEGVVSLLLRRVPLDPRLEALYRMVCMDSVDERHELMALMMKHRRAGECFCGGDHSSMSQLSDKDGDDLESFCCAICHFRKRPGSVTTNSDGVVQELMVCRECEFAVCTFCLPGDEGWTPPADPYGRLADEAVALGAKMANVGGWFGGRGHMCGLPRVQCRTGIAPRAYRGNLENEEPRFGSDVGVAMCPDKQVLHDGIRLRVLLDEKVRDILVDQGQDYASVEIDKVLPKGATIGDMISYRDALKKSTLWPIVVEVLENQFSHYRTRDGDPARAYQTTKKLSFGVEEAVFELGARVDDGDY